MDGAGASLGATVAPAALAATNRAEVKGTTAVVGARVGATVGAAVGRAVGSDV